MSEEIVIIGSSFSGLGTAIACAKHGYNVKIIAPKGHSNFIGGLQIAPNGFAALSSIGVEKEILNAALRLLAVKKLVCLAKLSIEPHRWC